MSTRIKSVLVGVSNYYIDRADNLQFCKNDIDAMKNALINGLKADETNIVTCGSNGDVYKADFLRTLKSFAVTVDGEDILIFYFSGHGTTIDGEHFLVLSDGIIRTQEIIGFFEDIESKSKIVFLDCCMSGNYKVSTSASYNIGKTIEEFYGKGYAVFVN